MVLVEGPASWAVKQSNDFVVITRENLLSPGQKIDVDGLVQTVAALNASTDTSAAIADQKESPAHLVGFLDGSFNPSSRRFGAVGEYQMASRDNGLFHVELSNFVDQLQSVARLWIMVQDLPPAEFLSHDQAKRASLLSDDLLRQYSGKLALERFHRPGLSSAIQHAVFHALTTNPRLSIVDLRGCLRLRSVVFNQLVFGGVSSARLNIDQSRYDQLLAAVTSWSCSAPAVPKHERPEPRSPSLAAQALAALSMFVEGLKRARNRLVGSPDKDSPFPVFGEPSIALCTPMIECAVTSKGHIASHTRTGFMAIFKYFTSLARKLMLTSSTGLSLSIGGPGCGLQALTSEIRAIVRARIKLQLFITFYCPAYISPKQRLADWPAEEANSLSQLQPLLCRSDGLGRC